MARWVAELTQYDLAERSGLCERYVAEVERGNRNLSLCSLFLIAQGLNVPVSALVSAENEESTDLVALVKGKQPKRWHERKRWDQLFNETFADSGEPVDLPADRREHKNAAVPVSRKRRKLEVRQFVHARLEQK